MAAVRAPAPALSELRPLSMGELMDRAAGFWRSHWKPLFQLYLGFQLAGFALMKLLVLAMRSWFPLLQGGLALANAVKDSAVEVARQAAIGIAIGVPIFALYVWLLWLASIATSWYVIRECLGERPSTGASVRYSLQRVGPATRTLALFLLISAAACVLATFVFAAIWAVAVLAGRGFGAVVFALLGFALWFALLLGFLWYFLRFLVIAPVLAAEQLGAVESIRRSAHLISGRIGPGLMNRVKVRATVLMTAMMIVILVVTSLGSLPAAFVTFAYSNPWNPGEYNPGSVPEYLLVPAQLLQVGVQSLFGPLYLALASLFYLDMRMRREGLDLEVRLRVSSGEKA